MARKCEAPEMMKRGDLVRILDGHRTYFQSPDDVAVGGIIAIFLDVSEVDWCPDFFLYRFLTARGLMELVMNEDNANDCFVVV